MASNLGLRSANGGLSVRAITGDLSALVIDSDRTESLLIRKNNDGGDVLAVNNTTNTLLLGNSAATTNTIRMLTDSSSTSTLSFADDVLNAGFIQYSHSDNLMKLSSSGAIRLQNGAVRLATLLGDGRLCIGAIDPVWVFDVRSDSVNQLNFLSATGDKQLMRLSNLVPGPVLEIGGTNMTNSTVKMNTGITGTATISFTDYDEDVGAIRYAHTTNVMSFTTNALPAMTINSGQAVLLANCSAEPATPASGGALYVVAGELRYKGSSGTITVLGVA